MGLSNFLGRIFKKKDKCEKACLTTTVVKPEETVKAEETKSETPYVYKIGDTTVYDCIVEAKSMGCDMRFINDKISSLDSPAFIAWFQEYKKNLQ